MVIILESCRPMCAGRAWFTSCVTQRYLQKWASAGGDARQSRDLDELVPPGWGGVCDRCDGRERAERRRRERWPRFARAVRSSCSKSVGTPADQITCGVITDPPALRDRYPRARLRLHRHARRPAPIRGDEHTLEWLAAELWAKAVETMMSRATPSNGCAGFTHSALLSRRTSPGSIDVSQALRK
jgi:hypothetical protein